MEWAGNRKEVWDEPAIEVAESNEGVHPFYRGRGIPFINCLQLGRVHCDMSLLYDYSQVLYVWHTKGAFLQFEVQLVLSEMLKDFAGSFLMGSLIARMD